MLATRLPLLLKSMCTCVYYVYYVAMNYEQFLQETYELQTLLGATN